MQLVGGTAQRLGHLPLAGSRLSLSCARAVIDKWPLRWQTGHYGQAS